jgi:hypothetical protein
MAHFPKSQRAFLTLRVLSVVAGVAAMWFGVVAVVASPGPARVTVGGVMSDCIVGDLRGSSIAEH